MPDSGSASGEARHGTPLERPAWRKEGSTYDPGRGGSVWRRIWRAVHGAGLLLVVCLCVAGCGEAQPGEPVRTVVKVVHPVPTSPRAAPGAQSVAARMDVSADRIVAEGKVHIAPGAPSDAEVRRELRAARRAGAVVPSGDSVQSFAEAQSQAVVPVAEVETPEASWNPRGKPIATWIVPVLQWAYLHGWRGSVTSGYRTLYEQLQLNAAGAYSAPAGLSNHETARYPGGAVDVTEPAQLTEILRGYPGQEKLVGGKLGPVDPEHFSATGD
jgi:hypothetical protein